MTELKVHIVYSKCSWVIKWRLHVCLNLRNRIIIFCYRASFFVQKTDPKKIIAIRASPVFAAVAGSYWHNFSTLHSNVNYLLNIYYFKIPIPYSSIKKRFMARSTLCHVIAECEYNQWIICRHFSFQWKLQIFCKLFKQVRSYVHTCIILKITNKH